MRVGTMAGSVALMIASAMSSALAQPSGAPRLRVAVMDLSGSALSMQTAYAPTTTTTTIAIPPPAEFARGLTEMLTTALFESGRFVVLERKTVDDALDEQDFGAGGRVNPETAPAVGRAVGAQVLITGDVTEFTYQKSSVGGNISILRSVGATGERLKAMVALDLRLVDVVTGEVVFSKRVDGEAAATGVSADVQVGDQQFGSGISSQTPLGQASREAIGKAVAAIVEGLRDVPWSGRIVDVRGESIYVNAGAEGGMAPGTRLDVFAQGETLVDPETGVALGTPDVRVGSVEVVQVEEKYAVARIVSGSGFARGHLLRLGGSAANP